MRDLYENQQRLLNALREAGDEPVSVDELDAVGVTNPATTVYELQLTGHPIERVYERDTQRFAGFNLPRVARERLAAQEAEPPPPRRFAKPEWLGRLSARRASAG